MGVKKLRHKHKKVQKADARQAGKHNKVRTKAMPLSGRMDKAQNTAMLAYTRCWHTTHEE
jgi:hypothetical protein